MRAAVYARFSSDNQRSESIDAQIREINEYAIKNNISIVKIYADEAKSAKTDDRPQFQKMIKDAERQMFEALLIHKLDRFARNRYDSAIYKAKLRSLGVQVISIKEKLDNSPESVILESMLEGMAEYYSMNLAREVMKGMRENAYTCRHTGGKPPFGFDVDSDLKYIINEHEAIAVKKIFIEYASGKSYRDIIIWLSGMGYTTKYGKPFQRTSLNNLLKNEKYIGKYSYNRYKRVKKGGLKMNKKNPDDEIITIEDGIPAIVTKEIFDKVQKQLGVNKESMRSLHAKEEYLLSGVLFCGQCGSKMNGARRNCGRNKSLYITYQCANRKKQKTCTKKEVNRDFIENIIINHLENNVFTDDFINDTAQKMHEKYLETTQSSKNNAKIYDDELKKINGKITNITNAVADGLYHESMKNKMDELELQKNEIITLLIEEKSKQHDQFTIENIKSFLTQGKGIINKSFKEKKILINTFVTKVELSDDEVTITLRIRDKDSKGNKRKAVSSDVPVDNDASSPLLH